MKQRARTDEDKLLRRAAIVDAGREVFDATEIDAFTMDAVAARLGLAKGTLYRYVPTREALLLALTLDEYVSWFDDVDATLARTPVSADDAATVTAIVVDSLLARPRFLRLASLVATVLERNVPFDTAREFKLGIVDRSESTVRVLAARFGCPPERAKRLMVHVQALALGLYHHAHPAPVVAEVLADPAFTGMHIDYRAELTVGVDALVRAAIG